MTTALSSPRGTPTISDRRRHAMVLLLAVVGGSVDATVILAFGVLIAAQTGNTILLAVSLVQRQFERTLHSIISVAGYVGGAALAEMIIVKRESAESGGSPVLAALLTELLALVSLLVLWYISERRPAFGPLPLLVILGAIAMGTQSATVLRLHSGPKTTYVTGTLTNFTTKAVQWLRSLETAPASAHRTQGGSGDPPWIYGMSWFVYASGAALGGFLFLRFHEAALLLPIGALLAVILINLGVS